MGDKEDFSTDAAETTGYPYGEKRSFCPYITPHTEVHLRWFINATYKTRAINLEECRGECLSQPEPGKDFYVRMWRALTIKDKIDELDYIKINNVRSLKNAVKKVKR